MKKYNTEQIRNLAFVGHSGAGKTTLAEALLYLTHATERMGRIEDKNTVSDFDPEEQARRISIGLSVLPVEWKDYKINLLDAPGYFDFASEVLVSLRAAEAALMVIDASAGIVALFRFTEERSGIIHFHTGSPFSNRFPPL